MQRFGMRAFAVLFYLALEAALAWALLSGAESFIAVDWRVVHDSPLGRAAWLCWMVWAAKGSIASAIASADRYMSKAADAQPTASA